MMNNTHNPKQGLEKRIQCVCFTLLLALLVAIGSSALVLASDVSDALWRGGITITNTGTAATAVSVNMSLDSASFIENGYAAADLTDTALHTQINGIDTAFMPSVNSSYPWVIFVPSIGAGLSVNYDLYSGGATGGKICYFPDTGGMTSIDSDTLEPSANFTFEQKGWIDTTNGTADKNLVYKAGAFRTYVSDTVSGNITSEIGDDTAATWVNPTGFVDPDTAWATEAEAYDENVTTDATAASAADTYTSWLEFTHASITINSVKSFNSSATSGLECDIYYDSDWHNIYSDDPPTGWSTVTFSKQTVTAARIRIKRPTADAKSLFEFDFGEDQDFGGVAASVTATGVSSSNHTVTTTANTTHLWIEINGETKDTVALSGGSVPDNSFDWAFLQNGSVIYAGSDNGTIQQIWVGGVLQQHIEWEYDTTFTDFSGKSHDATPTFRTNSSNANVSAELTSFEPVDQAELDTFSLVSSLEILTANATLPSEMYSELDVSRIPGGEAVTELLTEGGIPQSAWWFPFLYLGICVVGLIMYGATTLGRSGLRGKLAEGQVDGSLLVMFIVMEIPLAMLGIMGVTPFWPAILFPIAGVAIIISRKHYSWG